MFSLLSHLVRSLHVVVPEDFGPELGQLVTIADFNDMVLLQN